MGLLRSACALKINSGVRAEFVDNLAARSARRAWHAFIVCDGNRLDFYFRTQLRHRREDRGSLCAVRHSVRCIFDVAPSEDLSIRKKNGSSDVEVRIGCVGILHHFGRRILEFLANTGGQLLPNFRQVPSAC